jgi:HAD superfamily phosphatase (TIGR01668 family)
MDSIQTDSNERTGSAETTRPADRRRKLSGVHMLCPHRFCHSGVTEITVDDLKAEGVDTVLLDLDNTLVEWQRRDMHDTVRQWLLDLQAADMKLYLVSNTRFGKRIIHLSEELNIPHVRRAWKPRKKGFLHAMKELGSTPEKTVIIGDQMFTDILGGNRLGLYTVMVHPIGRREFFGTKISRAAERIFLAWFRKKGHI